MPARTARVLAERYELGPPLGSGGMAEVYAGYDRLLARRVAIKILRPQYADDPAFLDRFTREARSAASLAHPQVVAVYDIGAQDDAHFIVMELVDGRNLAGLLRARAEPLPPERAAQITADVCLALTAAHERGIVHRDVTPANIMIGNDGAVKVADFGIAKAASAASMTQTMIGTPQYMSPEQAQGLRVDHRSDLYSLGCCLYEMLTGQPPFTGSTAVATAYRQVHETPRPPRELNPQLPLGLEAVTLKAIAKDPAGRFQSAQQLGEAVARAAAEANGAPTVVLDALATQPPDAKPRARGRVSWAAAFLVTLVVIAVLFVFATAGNPGDKNTTTTLPQTATTVRPSASSVASGSVSVTSPPPTSVGHNRRAKRHDGRGHRHRHGHDRQGKQ